jgi:hypothetical protein
MKLEQSKMFELLKRFPNVNLSYESSVTTSNVTSKYDVYLEIPKAKKYFIWFTYYEDSNVCFLLELNKEKTIISAKTDLNLEFNRTLSLGTVLYGSLIENNTFCSQNEPQSFIVEDILMFKGIILNTSFFIEKINYIIEVLKLLDRSSILFFIVSVKKIKSSISENNNDSSRSVSKLPPTVPLYPIHHYQYRSLNHKCPYLNSKTPELLNVSAIVETKTNTPKNTKTNSCLSSLIIPTIKNCSKPQYRLKTTFLISAESVCDIYSLYALDKNNQQVFYDYAYIPNLKSSMYMNKHFRIIKENINIDYIEESDDEDDFQNTDYNKHVDLQKRLVFDCVFHSKFKRWIPVKLLEESNCMSKVVQLKKLVV